MAKDSKTPSDQENAIDLFSLPTSSFSDLAAENELFRILADSTAASVFIMQGSRMYFINAYAEKMTGFSREELLDMDFWEVIHPDHREMVKERGLARQQGEDIPNRYQVKILTAGGETRWMDYTATVIEFRGSPGVLGTAFDITEKMAAEEALRNSEAQLRALIEHAPEAIVVLDAESGVITSASGNAGNLFGVAAEDLVGVHPGTLGPRQQPDGEDSNTAAVKRIKAAREEGPITFEWTHRNAEGENIPCEIRLVPLPDTDNKLIRASITNISERYKKYNELEVIASVSNALRQATTRAAMFPVIAQQLETLINVTGTTINTLHPSEAHFVVEFANLIWEDQVKLTVPASNEIVDYVLSSGETYVNNDVQDNKEQRFMNAETLQRANAVACAPLSAQGEILGTLWVGRDNAFTEENLQYLKVISNIAATALQRTTLHEKTRALFTESQTYAKELEEKLAELEEAKEAIASRNLELARLYRAFGNLVSTATPQLNSLAQNIVETVLQEFGQSNCSLIMIDPSQSKLQRIAASGPYSEEVSQGKLYIDGAGIVPRAIRTGEIVNVPNVTLDSNYVPNWEAARSEMAIPLKLGSTVIGAIDVQSAEVNAFSQEDQRLMSLFAERAALAIENARLFGEAHRRLDQLQGQRDLGMAINASLDLRLILNMLLNQATSQLKAHAAAVLLNDESQMLRYSAGRGFQSRAIEETNIPIGNNHAGRAALERRLIHVPNLQETGAEFMRPRLLSEEGFETYFAIPLIAKGQVMGVLEIFHRGHLQADVEWLGFLETLASQAATAIYNADLFDNLQSAKLELEVAYGATLEGWVRALDMRDHETEGHTQRVTEMTLRLANVMKVSPEEMTHISRGALLHDIGKMAIPDEILRKPGKLTDKEWELMRMHPVYAYELIKPIAYLEAAIDIPYCHHEKWDGSGYPTGLKGEQIPLAARIFAIVDVWDALRSDRPYRKAWPEDKVLEYIREQSGEHFDPKVVEAFLTHLHNSQ
ncbi:MAG: PAS domain S-box protein [Chloroflexi bacterium]|nr:MAG: PAS domain S-box protein [Chloroflexota bacterium]MBL1196864.1 PAS domain S-box protein [Chloroflexota bacterium]NOH14160.1 GAF domain-containing protein [Chloroflexota bacterium]